MALAAGAGAENPHWKARRCLDHYAPGCDQACAICHSTIGESLQAPAEAAPAGFFADLGLEDPPAPMPANLGDTPLCMECHPEKGGFHGHPVAVRYRQGPKNHQYRAQPQGPKLFCDEGGSSCWVFCSTCHDPHHGTGKGIRRASPEASLCLACHIK